MEIVLNESREIKSIVALRGLACISVCIGHFSGTFSDKFFFEIFHYGIWGVNLFFIISGFILPYSMYQNKYNIRALPKFILKRFIRIDPPFLISILIIILISFIAQFSTYNNSQVINLFDINTLYNVSYLVDVLKKGSWLNIVFWTLAIEFQFYILIALVLPFINNNIKWVRYFSFLSLTLIAYFFNKGEYILYYLLYFLLGFIIFQFYCKLINKIEFLFFMPLILVLLGFKFANKFDFVGIICSFVFIIFFFLTDILNNKAFFFLGKISYSLYLLHTPLGTDSFVQFFQNYFKSDISQIIIAISGIIFVIICSWIYYKFIESKFQNLSKKLKYK